MRQNSIVGSIRLLIHLALCWLFSCWGVSLAVRPAAEILPNTTCMYVSFPDMDAFRASFDKTQLGQLAQDPVMKPFADDFGKQLKERFGKTKVQLGLKWSDLDGVYAGEACIARVQPNNDKNDHAVMLLLDVTGKDAQVQKVRQTVANNMKARKAVESFPKIGDAAVTQYKLIPKRGTTKTPYVYLTVHQDQLLVTNHLGLLKDVLSRVAKPANDSSLAEFNMFGEVMAQVEESAKGEVPHVKWYLHPFKFAEVARASRRGRGTRGKNLAKTLVGQGFDAIRSAGGHLNMATNGYELLHRTFIYAPPVTNQPTRFKAAARSLVFPAGQHLPAPKWLPRNLATVTSLNWKVLDGFNYSISLIDEMFKQEGLMEEVLDSFKEDVGVNLRGDLLAHLDDQIIFFTDYRLPITTSSERLLVAVRVKDKSEAAVRKAVDALGEFEPQAKAVKIAGQDAWEIVSQGDAGDDELISGIELPGAGGIPLPGGDLEPAAGDELSLPNSAIAISTGPDASAPSYLFVASDADLLEEVLSARKEHNTLAASEDFKFVGQLLGKLGAGEDSIRVFSRSDESFRSAYEMIQMGQMPESDSLLGRLLNRLLGPDDDTQMRKPEIDGSKLPDYQIVRRYLGPAGVFVQPHPNGWSVTGIMIGKDQIIGNNAGSQARLTSRP